MGPLRGPWTELWRAEGDGKRGRGLSEIDVISLYPPQCEVKRTAQRTSPSISPDLLEHRCKMTVKLKTRANLSVGLGDMA